MVTGPRKGHSKQESNSEHMLKPYLCSLQDLWWESWDLLVEPQSKPLSGFGFPTGFQKLSQRSDFTKSAVVKNPSRILHELGPWWRILHESFTNSDLREEFFTNSSRNSDFMKETSWQSWRLHEEYKMADKKTKWRTRGVFTMKIEKLRTKNLMNGETNKPLNSVIVI